MPHEQTDPVQRRGEHPVRHSAAYIDNSKPANTTSSLYKETVFGEDLAATTQVFNNLLSAGFDFDTSRTLLVPRIVVGIKSERDYRRECHKSLKALGHVAGRQMYSATERVISADTAAGLLIDFVEVTQRPGIPQIGFELGHIELAGADISVDKAWQQLDNLGERIIDLAHLDRIDAHHIKPSDRGALFPAEDLEMKEIKLPRARTNFPVADIGQTGLQLFVRVSVGYDNADLSPVSLHDLRVAHSRYMDEHTQEVGITMLGDKTFAYPLSATLVALNRNQAA